MAEYICELPVEGIASFVSGGELIPVHERIVRCRDCKHATPDTSGRKRYKGYMWCDELTEGIGFSVAPSDFCAWGEVPADGGMVSETYIQPTEEGPICPIPRASVIFEGQKFTFDAEDSERFAKLLKRYLRKCAGLEVDG